MKSILHLIFLSSIFLGSCKQEETPETFLAKVGNQALTFEELIERYPQPAGQGRTLNREIIDQWVQHELLYQEALTRQLDKKDHVKRRISNSAEDILVNELLEQIFTMIRVEDSEISEYYQKHTSDFIRTDDEVRLIHIAYPPSPETEKVLQKVRNVKELQDFLNTTTEIPLNEVNPDMGYLSLNDLLPDLSLTANKLLVGQLSRPIPIGDTRHLIGLIDRRSRGTEKSFDQVKEEIRERIFIQKQRQAHQQFIESLKKKYPISINLPVINQPSDTTEN